MAMTIKELADSLGVSKPTVSNAIELLGIQGELCKVGNRFVLDEAQTELVKSKILEKTQSEVIGESPKTQKSQNEVFEKSPKTQESQSKSVEKSQNSQRTPKSPNDQVDESKNSIVSILESQILILQRQLNEKDKQIEVLTSALTVAQTNITALSTALDNEQRLHAGTIGTMQKQLDTAVESVPEEEAVSSETAEHKKGFLSRLFNRRK